jgi:hypothetical protein
VKTAKKSAAKATEMKGFSWIYFAIDGFDVCFNLRSYGSVNIFNRAQLSSTGLISTKALIGEPKDSSI